MGWYVGDHMNGWGWLGMTVSTLVLIGLLVLGGVLLVRTTRRDDGSPSAPEDVLADRYARGEIDDEEYRRRLATLADTGGRRR